jgi:hypothetical protein
MKETNNKIEAAIAQWQASQQGQTSGYEYEMSFLQFWQQLGLEVFQQSVGELPKRRHEKKTTNPFGSDYSSKGSCPS